MTPEQLARLAAVAPMPWTTDAQVEPGVIYDAIGNVVLVVDVWSDISDQQAFEIAEGVTQLLRHAMRTINQAAA